jgi:hypothetical protein
MNSRVFFVWQYSPRGPVPSLYFDVAPGDEAKRGVRILAVHELTPGLAQAAMSERLSPSSTMLARKYPAPKPEGD